MKAAPRIGKAGPETDLSDVESPMLKTIFRTPGVASCAVGHRQIPV